MKKPSEFLSYRCNWDRECPLSRRLMAHDFFAVEKTCCYTARVGNALHLRDARESCCASVTGRLNGKTRDERRFNGEAHQRVLLRPFQSQITNFGHAKGRLFRQDGTGNQDELRLRLIRSFTLHERDRWWCCTKETERSRFPVYLHWLACSQWLYEVI